MLAVRAILAWPALFGLYLLLSGSAGWHECLAGLVAASLATLLVVRVHRLAPRQLVLRPPPSLPLRVLAALAVDCVRVGLVLLRAILRRPDGAVGQAIRQPFAGGGETPRDAGRRGLVTLAASLAPNGIVLHVPGGQDVLVLHRLAPAPPSTDLRWPA